MTSLPKTLLEREADGDSAYYEGNFLAAAYFFEKSQSSTPSSNQLNPISLRILWKLALSLFQLDSYTQALSHCDTILHLNQHREPSVLKVKCLWGLGRYQDALQYLEDQDNPDTNLLLQAQTALLTSQGRLDIDHLASLPQSQTHFHIGEYSGSYRVATLPGKGRGLVATADLQGGTLILIKNAFALASISELSLQDPGQECWKSVARKLLVWKVFQKIHSNSELRETFCDLSSDRKSLQSPNWLRDQWVDDKKLRDTSQKDAIMTEIEFKILNNVFGTENSLGIWFQAAYLNHSCADFNVARSIFGNVMVIRCVKDVKAGEELTMAYVHPGSDKRLEILKQHCIPCNCRLCECNAESEVIQRIRTCPNLTEKTQLFKQLCSVSGATFSVLDLSLVNLGKELYAKKEFNTAREVMETQRAFCAANFLWDDCINLDLNLFTIYLDTGDKEGAKVALEWLKNNMLVAYGQVSAGMLKDYQVVRNLRECGINFEEILNNPEAVNSIRISRTGL